MTIPNDQSIHLCMERHITRRKRRNMVRNLLRLTVLVLLAIGTVGACSSPDPKAAALAVEIGQETISPERMLAAEVGQMPIHQGR